jgi:quercetin dioxygenase-like cupin family protein
LLKKSVDLASPQITANVVRVTFPAGSKVPTHTHPGPGPRYVVKGKLKVVDGGETKIYTAGDVFWETGREMTVENVAGDESQLVIFEMAPRE